MEERNCNNCNNYRPSGDYRNTEQSDRKMMIPVIITILLCVIAYLGWQNYDLKQKHQNCISVDSDGNMWFTKGILANWLLHPISGKNLISWVSIILKIMKNSK